MQEIIQEDHQLFLFLNNLGSQPFDQFWLLISEIWIWIPLYIILLYFLYKNFKLRSFIFIIIFVALGVTFTDQLANLILADVALTQKILRLANTVTFRGTSNQVVTSISRAVQLLGLDTVKGCALAMILVDRMPGKHSRFVRKELMYALTASLISHKLAKQSCFPNAEEVAIAALFKNMGRL